MTKETVCVACGEGALEITELQLQGKKRMDTAAFLRGYHLEPGTRLGQVKKPLIGIPVCPGRAMSEKGVLRYALWIWLWLLF